MSFNGIDQPNILFEGICFSHKKNFCKNINFFQGVPCSETGLVVFLRSENLKTMF